MRTTAKVFIIISMVLNTILGFIFLPIGLIFIGLALSVGIPALSKISDEFEKPSIAISICTLVLLSPIAGILMLCIPDDTRHYNQIVWNQCEKCGKRDVMVKYYYVDTALGKMNRAYCPECKQTIGISNPTPQSFSGSSSGIQCEKCGKRDSTVRRYYVNTYLGKMERKFCLNCKQIFDEEQQNK